MSPLPGELNDESFQTWLTQEKWIDRPISWDLTANRVNMVPVEIFNNVFADPVPRLSGWIHRYDFTFQVFYKGKYRIIAADYEGHGKGYRDPCSREEVPDSHVHYFQESCPKYQVRRPFPPEMAALGMDPLAVLKELLVKLNVRHSEITPFKLPKKQARLFDE